MSEPRVDPLAIDDVAPEVRTIFDVYQRERGNVPNMFRTVAVRPHYLQTMIAHFRTVMTEGTVPALLKELLWVRISHLNACHYCLASHTVLARRHGASDALLDALEERGGTLDGLAPGWRTALEYADILHRSGHDVTDELYARLASAWDPGQIVELTTVIGLTEYFNRFNNALRVAPTR